MCLSNHSQQSHSWIILWSKGLWTGTTILCMTTSERIQQLWCDGIKISGLIILLHMDHGPSHWVYDDISQPRPWAPLQGHLYKNNLWTVLKMLKELGGVLLSCRTVVSEAQGLSNASNVGYLAVDQPLIFRLMGKYYNLIFSPESIPMEHCVDLN